MYIHLGLWGIGAGAAVTLFMSDVPVFRKDVLLKIPFVGFFFLCSFPLSWHMLFCDHLITLASVAPTILR
jgi:hypothetical protein